MCAVFVLNPCTQTSENLPLRVGHMLIPSSSNLVCKVTNAHFCFYLTANLEATI